MLYGVELRSSDERRQYVKLTAGGVETTDRILAVAGMILSAGVAAGCALFAVAFGVPALPFREELQGCLLGAFVTCGLAGLGLSVAAGCAGRD